MDIKFNISYLNKTTTNQLVLNLNYLKKCNPELDYSKIQLIFSDNTLNDVTKFQIEHGLPAIGHSENAKGKVLHYFNNHITYHAIFLDYETFSPFIEKDVSSAYLETFLINHELGHIYESYLTEKFRLNTDFSQHLGTRKQFTLEQISKAAFSEYVANIFAKNLFVEDANLELVFPYFYNQFHSYVMTIPQLLDDAKKETISTRDGVEIQNIAFRFFYFTAQLAGLFGGIDFIKNNITPSSLLEFHKDYPLEIINSFNNTIYSLHNILVDQSNWDKNFLEPLQQCIIDFWNSYNFICDDLLYFSLNE